jgi:hypothetical protein
MALCVPTVAPPVHVSTAIDDTAAFDERWSAWLAKGAAQDRATRRTMTMASPFLLAIAAAVLYALLGR